MMVKHILYLIVVGDAAVRRGGHNLRCGRSEVSRRHDAGLGHPETQDEVVPPQRHGVVAGAGRAGLLRVHWAAVGTRKEKEQVRF